MINFEFLESSLEDLERSKSHYKVPCFIKGRGLIVTSV